MPWHLNSAAPRGRAQRAEVTFGLRALGYPLVSVGTPALLHRSSAFALALIARLTGA
jgi:hypothetical protein